MDPEWWKKNQTSEHFSRGLMFICIYMDYSAPKLGLTLTLSLVFIVMIIKLGKKNIRSITCYDGGCYKKLNYSTVAKLYTSS